MTIETLRIATTPSHHSLSLRYPMYNKLYLVEKLLSLCNLDLFLDINATANIGIPKTTNTSCGIVKSHT